MRQRSVPDPDGRAGQRGDPDDEHAAGGGVLRGQSEQVDQRRNGEGSSPTSQPADDEADDQPQSRGRDHHQRTIVEPLIPRERPIDNVRSLPTGGQERGRAPTSRQKGRSEGHRGRVCSPDDLADPNGEAAEAVGHPPAARTTGGGVQGRRLGRGDTHRMTSYAGWVGGHRPRHPTGRIVRSATVPGDTAGRRSRAGPSRADTRRTSGVGAPRSPDKSTIRAGDRQAPGAGLPGV